MVIGRAVRLLSRNSRYHYVAAAAVVAATQLAPADNFSWTGAAGPSSAFWDQITANWDNTTVPTPTVPWTNNANRATPNTAVFNLVTPTSIAVNDNIDVGAITFTTSGWTLGAGTGVLAFGATGTLAITNSVAGINTINAVIADGSTFGAGGGVTSLSATGPGLLVLGATNTYTGNTSVLGGNLSISADANLGAGSGANNIILAGGGTLTASSSFTLNAGRGVTLGATANDGGVLDAATGVTLTYNGVLADNAGGAGAFFKGIGAGTVILGGANTYTGSTNVSGGMLKLAGSLASTTVILTGGTFQLAGGTLAATSSLTMNGGATAGTFDLNGVNQTLGALNGATGAVVGVITNTAASTSSLLTINNSAGSAYSGSINDGAGTIALTKSGAGTLTLNGVNSYSGATTVTQGVLAVNADAALGTKTGAGSIVMSNGTALFAAASFTLNSARGITLGANAGDSVTFDAANTVGTSLTYNGILSDNAGGAANIIKGNQAGVVVLGGNNTFTGAVTILSNQGTSQLGTLLPRNALVVTANNALGTTAAGTTVGTASNPGELIFQGGVNYTTAEPVTIGNANGMVSGNIRSTTGSNLFAGNIALGTGNMYIGTDAGSSLALTGTITGTSTAFFKTGGGTLIISSPMGYTAPTHIDAQGTAAGLSPAWQGGTLKLTATGAIASANETSIEGNNSVLLIDSSASSASPITRAGNLYLNDGGKIIVNGNAGNTTTDVASLLISGDGNHSGFQGSAGVGYVIINPGAGQTSILQLTDLRERQTTAAWGDINFRGPNFGQAAGANVAQVLLTAPATASSFIGATTTVAQANKYYTFATVTDTAKGNTTSIATLDPVTGIRALNALIAGDYDTGTLTGSLTNGNARTTTSISLASNSTPYSLTLQGSNITVSGPGALRIGSTTTGTIGDVTILSQGMGNVISTGLTAGGTSASATTRAHIYVDGQLTISGVISNTGTTKLGINKAGPGDLYLTNAGNTFTTDNSNTTGPIRINEGSLSFDAAADLGNSANTIIMYNNSTLHLTGGHGLQTFAGTLQVGSTGTVVDASSINVQVDSGSTLAVGSIALIANTSAGFSKTGSGELRFTAAAAASSGTSFLRDGTLTFGSAGTFQIANLAAQLIISPGATLNFDSTASGATAFSHLGSSTFNGGSFTVEGNAAGNTADTANAVTLKVGSTSFSVTPGSGFTSLLTIASLTRNAGATLVVNGSNLGKTSVASTTISQVISTAAPTLTGGALGTTSAKILPYAIVNDSVNGVAFATYDTTTAGFTGGIRGLGAAGAAETTSSFTAGVNLELGASASNAGISVNSITLRNTGAAVGLNVSSGAMTDASGGILSVGSVTGNNISGGTLAFGSAEGIVHAVADLSISSQITGAAGLTKAGAGILTLTNTANSYSGGATSVNAGTLAVGSDLVLGASTVSLALARGATLEITGPGFSTNRAIALNTGAGNANISVDSGNTAIFNGVISDTAIASSTVPYNLPGSLNVTGAGTTNLTAANTYSGSTNVTNSTLSLSGGDNRLPVGTALTLTNSTLVLNSVNQTVASLSGDATSVITDPAVTPHTVTVTGASTWSTSTYAGTITNGSGQLALANTGGTLVLTNTTSTYTGGTIISGGEIIVAGMGSVGNTAVTFNGGLLGFSGASPANLDSTIANASTFNGGFDISTGSSTISANLQGAGGFTKAGAGTLVLSGANTYAGATTVNGGVLQIGSAASLPTGGALAVNSGTLDLDGQSVSVATLVGSGNINSSVAGAVTVTVTGASEFNGLLQNGSGTLALTKSGSGVFVLSNPGSNTYSGGTNITGGTLRVGITNALPIAGTVTISSGATFDLGGVNQTIGVLTNPGGNNTGVVSNSIATTTGVLTVSGTSTYDGLIQDGAGKISLTKSTGGTLTLTNTANSYTGVTSVTGGTLSVSADTQLGAVPAAITAGKIVINGGVLSASSSFTLSANRGVTLGAGGGTFGTIDVASGQTLTYMGTLAGAAGGMIKTGNGTLALGGGNTYTGTTTVTGGTLLLTAGSLASATTVQGGNTLAGVGSLAAIILQGTAHGAPGVAGVGTQSTPSLSMATNAVLDFDFDVATGSTHTAPGASDRYAITGAGGLLTFPSGTTVTLNLASGAANFTGTGSYELMSYANAPGVTNFVTGNGSTGSIILGSGWGAITGGAYSIVNDTTNLGIFLDFTVSTGVSAGSGTWKNGAADGLWTTNNSANNNWANAIPGSGADQFATFDDNVIGTPGTVDLNGNKTVGGILLNTASNGYTLGTPSTASILTMQSSSGSATITVNGGASHTINAPVNLASSTDITMDPGTKLTFAAAVTGAGNLSLNGSGTLIVSAVNSYGSTTLNGGTLGGSGSIAGTVTLNTGARIHPSTGLPANSATTLTVGTLSTNTGGTLQFNLITPGHSSVNDMISATTLNLNGGTLDFTNHTTGATGVGYYRIMQYSSITGAGLSSLTLPATANSIRYFLTTTQDPGYVDVHRGYMGDANDSGFVDLTDLTTLAGNWQQSGGWSQGDFDGSGFIDLTDLTILAGNWQTGIGAFGAAAESLDANNASWQAAVQSVVFGASVPEPTSLALLCMGAAGLLTRRRRK